MSYGAFSDPYCYPGTGVLKNIPGIRDQDRLEAFETMMTALRAEEPFPTGRLSLLHYRAIHRHLLQDVFSWAGRFRTVRISKGESMFCYPEHIGDQMRVLFAGLRAQALFRNLAAGAFAESAAGFLATLNAIHPFRDGNGRAQFAFLGLLAEQAGHPLDARRLDTVAFLAAMIRSFRGDNDDLAHEIAAMIAGPR